jgi:hypothetical protein
MVEAPGQAVRSRAWRIAPAARIQTPTAAGPFSDRPRRVLVVEHAQESAVLRWLVLGVSRDILVGALVDLDDVIGRQPPR